MTYSVELRDLEPEDLDLIHQIENDPQLWPWSEDARPYSRYAIRQYLAEQPGDIFRDRQLRLAIVADGEAVGVADLTDFSPRHLRAEVGIVVLRSHHRKGIATQALQKLAQYAHDRLHLRSLSAFVASDNLPAQGLFRQLGYHEVGSLKRWIEGQTDALLFQLVME
ncbi:MAG: GNAT family N-acetyltransferase [Bacteroidaceae bacterium]|nr:GNAT family N-acetyltransferase [Bacteroidaceae bacterium]